LTSLKQLDIGSDCKSILRIIIAEMGSSSKKRAKQNYKSESDDGSYQIKFMENVTKSTTYMVSSTSQQFDNCESKLILFLFLCFVLLLQITLHTLKSTMHISQMYFTCITLHG
jgi:hypothetical protein